MSIADLNESLTSHKPSSSSDTPSTLTKPCIAVLPFTDMSQEHNQEWFSEGITEEILNGLAKIPQLKVIARTSSFAFKNKDVGLSEIGEMLSATHVLEGSIRSAGTRIRVSTQLASTSDESQIWSGQYDDELTDVFAVQDKIAASILSSLNLYLLPAQQKAQLHQKVNPLAFKSYLQGRHQLNLLQLDTAIEYFDKAIELDKGFADPYGALARAHNLQIFAGKASWLEKCELVENSLKLALENSPSQREALAVRASNLFFVQREYQKSIDEFDRLIRLYPSDTTAVSLYRNVMVAINQPDKAIKLANQMVDLDPLSPQALNYRASMYIAIEQYESAKQDHEKVEELGAHIPQRIAGLAFIQGDYAGVNAQLDVIREQFGESAYLAYKARSAYLQGDTNLVEESLALIDKNVYVSHLEKSVHAFMQKDKSRFIDEYAEAVRATEFEAIRNLKSAGGLNLLDTELVQNPRYQAIFKEARLDAESLAKLRIPELPF